ncbi:hypothetical protein [Kineosporia sp. NBRC 101677]|uniref:hypothetical protein n=1 Tax=Kineosporia sp. NBRC 101677 TaxID=3032197 RepID=UPI002554B292|nr:hypothetical protein [Kineosporia sp. NBRC 101677]
MRSDASDLAVTGHDPDAVLAAKTLAAAATGLVMLTVAVVLLRAGAPVPVLAVAPVVLAATVGAYLIPDYVVRAQARRRRTDFVQALPVWCDLVALEMAGTAAPQEALVTAAEAGSTWPVQVLRDTLQRAVRARQSHWRALSDLGERIGVPDVAELGRLSQLVSHEGAQVRDTFIERAAGMRRRALADSLGQAGQRDESMRLAVLVIAAGVILLMLFPGVIAVINL